MAGNSPVPFDPATVLSSLRVLVGAGSWAVPSRSWRTFGLGPLSDPRSVLITRLFGVRDLALGAAVAKGDAELRHAALRIGVAVDTIDAIATVMARRSGASRSSLLLVGGGAVMFAALGVAALARPESPAP